jgi:hypothetical protein
LNKIKGRKKYARLHIKEILSEKKLFLKINFIYIKDKKKIIDKSKKLFKYKCITNKIIII